MSAAGRLGDKAHAPADQHGCPACPHAPVGPAVQGSGDVIINGFPALRIGDRGIHAACCGGNSWLASQGAAQVFINGRPSHRHGDETHHCGGAGHLISGSPNVQIGDHGGQANHATPSEPPEFFELALPILESDEEDAPAGRYPPRDAVITLSSNGGYRRVVAGIKGINKGDNYCSFRFYDILRKMKDDKFTAVLEAVNLKEIIFADCLIYSYVEASRKESDYEPAAGFFSEQDLADGDPQASNEDPGDPELDLDPEEPPIGMRELDQRGKFDRTALANDAESEEV